MQGGHHQGCAGTLEEGGRIGEGRVRAQVMSFKAVSDSDKKKKKGGTERIKAAAQEIHTGTTGHLDA